MISVTICSPGPDLVAPWQALAAPGEANVFMHPAALLAAAATGYARIHVLVAYDEAAGLRRPVGLWALQERRALPLTPSFLDSLPYNYAFTSDPVIAEGYADEVVDAFFTAIRREAALPKVINLRSFAADTPVYRAMVGRLAANGRSRRRNSRWRPSAASRPTMAR